jgi:hypothetical protein
VLYLIANIAAVILCSILLFLGGVYVDRFIISPPEMVSQIDYRLCRDIIEANEARTSNAKFNKCDNERDELSKRQLFLSSQLRELLGY